MKIQKIDKELKYSFKSLRTDKNEISTLKTGTMPILENRRINILASLDRLSQDPTRSNIAFLLDIADNIQYGQNGNSEFRDTIDATTEAPEERENTDWSQTLSDTIKQALQGTKEDVSDLRQRYDEIFTQKHPLTEEQKEVLDLRAMVKQAVINEKTLEDSDAISRSADVSKKIDLFISSSEIPLGQKKDCLTNFLYLLSDEYPIVPQLKDKKVQVLDEMLDDMLIKVPGQKELTTKGVDQLYSGICAAISICRKAVAYEDKTRYTQIVLEELKDSDTMEVFDVTELGEGKKVKIPKINIDYDSAMAKGYRILDAAAHLWMQNAHSSGNGTIQSENFVAFDDDTYGIFNDSSWYEGFNPNYSQEQSLLRILIKEKELLDSVLTQKKKISETGTTIKTEKEKTIFLQTKINGELNRTFASIFPEMTEDERTKLIKSTFRFYKGSKEDNEVNISQKMPEDLQKKIIADHLKQEAGILPDDETKNSAIDNNAGKILGLVREYINSEDDLKKLNLYNSKKSRYLQNRRLYQLAAAHRMAIEADVNTSIGIRKYEIKSGLPTRTEQISSYLNELETQLREGRNGVFERFSDGKDIKQLEKEIAEDRLNMEVSIPNTLNDISKKLFGIDTQEQIKRSFAILRQRIKFGDSALCQKFSNLVDIKNDKSEVINFIDQKAKAFSKDMTIKEQDELIRLLGFDNRIEFFKSIFIQFTTNLKEGITQEEFQELVKLYGGEEKINSAIADQQKRLQDTIKEYEGIEKRWQIPSQRQLILERIEKSGKILPYKKLNALRTKFDYILAQARQNESIQNIKDRQKADEKTYTFSDVEEDIFASVERNLHDIKKFCNTTYSVLNRDFREELEQQYSSIGMLNGQFWVREEGSSGLSSTEQLRIIEQMTDKQYHIEKDIEKAAKQVKKGEGSGIISYSVDDESYAFHAQYVPSVTTETMTSPITGEKTEEEVIWTDNSWGKGEKDSFWSGQDGFKYTDYGRGFGWKGGFILADDLRIGKKVQDVKNAVGYEKKENDRFNLYIDMIMSGVPVNAYQRLYEMFSYVLDTDRGVNKYSDMESQIKKGKKVPIKSLEGVDDILSLNIDQLKKQVDKIKTKEDWDKLPKDSFLKRVLSIMSVYTATNNPQIAESVIIANNLEEVEESKSIVIDDIMSEFQGLLGKEEAGCEKLILASYNEICQVFDDLKKKYNIDIPQDKRNEVIGTIFQYDEELDGSLQQLEDHILKNVIKAGLKLTYKKNGRNFFIGSVKRIIKDNIENYFKIKSLDNHMLQGSPSSEYLIAAVDKYLGARSDEDLVNLLAGLQYADSSKSDAFLNALQVEDLGINFKDPYEFVQQIQNGDSDAVKAFHDIIINNTIHEYTRQYGSIADTYRSLYVLLSDMDVQNYIKDFKEEAFRKYKVRQAFPDPIVLSKDKLEEVCISIFQYIDETIKSINDNKFSLQTYEDFSTLIRTVNSGKLSDLFNNGKDISNQNEDTKQELQTIYNLLIKFRDTISKDKAPVDVAASVDTILKNIKTNKGKVTNIDEVTKSYKELTKKLNQWESSGITGERFIQKIKELREELYRNVKFLVETNFPPKYKDEAYRKMQELIKSISANKNSEDIEDRKNEFTYLFTRRHILNFPTTLLAECTNMVQSGKSETDEYNVLKEYLNRTLKVAQQTRTQYKMVKNAHDGISTKTKDLLPYFMSDGSKHDTGSETGMIYIINQLENESDNNATLKLFLAQSGLSELALKALINNFNKDESKKIIDETADEIEKNIKDYSQLQSYIAAFFNQNRIRFRNFKDAANHLAKFITNKTKNSQNEIAKQFVEYITAKEITSQLNHIQSDLIIETLASLSQKASTEISDFIDEKIEFLEGTIEVLDNRMKLIDTIEVPDESEAGQKRIEFRKEYEQLSNYFDSRISGIMDLISNANSTLKK